MSNLLRIPDTLYFCITNEDNKHDLFLFKILRLFVSFFYFLILIYFSIAFVTAYVQVFRDKRSLRNLGKANDHLLGIRESCENIYEFLSEHLTDFLRILSGKNI